MQERGGRLVKDACRAEDVALCHAHRCRRVLAVRRCGCVRLVRQRRSPLLLLPFLVSVGHVPSQRVLRRSSSARLLSPLRSGVGRPFLGRAAPGLAATRRRGAGCDQQVSRGRGAHSAGRTASAAPSPVSLSDLVRLVWLGTAGCSTTVRASACRRSSTPPSTSTSPPHSSTSAAATATSSLAVCLCAHTHSPSSVSIRQPVSADGSVQSDRWVAHVELQPYDASGGNKPVELSLFWYAALDKEGGQSLAVVQGTAEQREDVAVDIAGGLQPVRLTAHLPDSSTHPTTRWWSAPQKKTSSQQQQQQRTASRLPLLQPLPAADLSPPRAACCC